MFLFDATFIYLFILYLKLTTDIIKRNNNNYYKNIALQKFICKLIIHETKILQYYFYFFAERPTFFS